MIKIKTLFKHTKWSAQCVRMKETNKKVYDHTWWISILGPVGAYEVEAGAKKSRKKLWRNIQSEVRKMIAWIRGERKIKLNDMKLIFEEDESH